MEFDMRSTILPANLCTGHTTFFTLSYETFPLLEEGEFLLPRQTSLPLFSSSGLV
jgi:fluoride ion exporter CrcB/FEX